MDYNERSPRQAVELHLSNISGPSLIQFENSIESIKTYYELINKKRSITNLRRTIEILESTKDDLIKTIDGFIEKTDSWKWTKNTFLNIDESGEAGDFQEEDDLHEDELDDETKQEFIRTHFHLQHYFDFVDERIDRLNRIISLISRFHFHTEEKRKRVQLHTMVVLVWIIAFKNIGLSNRRSYAETRALLKWFSRNRRQFIEEEIGQQIHIGLDAIRRDFERYILNPTRETESYKELAETLYSQIFLEME